MKEQRDKYLTEAMGECWPDFAPNGFCRKCNCDKRFPYHIDFSTWQGFGKLWEFVQNRKLISEFLVWFTSRTVAQDYGSNWIRWELMTPDQRSDAVYEFLQGR